MLRKNDAHGLRNGDTKELIAGAIEKMSIEEAYNPSHVYAHILRKAIQKHYVLDELHLSDVLLALRRAGYLTNHKSGLLLASPGQSRDPPGISSYQRSTASTAE